MVAQDNILAQSLLYAFLSISLFSSSSNILIIIRERVVTNSFASIIFLMQVSSLGMTLIDFTFFPSINLTLCKIQSSLFYSFLTTNFLLLSYLFLKIYKTLRKDVNFIIKYNTHILITIFIVPLAFSFISFQAYSPCGYSEFNFYCGICYKEIPQVYRALVSLNYLVPCVFSIVIFSVLGVYLYKLDKSELGKDERLAISIIPIPVFNLTYLILDSIITVYINTTTAQDALFYFYLIVDSMYCLVPFINLVFYANFAYHWSIIMNEDELKCCRWMVCFNRQSKETNMLIADIKESTS